MIKNCLNCNKKFNIWPSDLKYNRGKDNPNYRHGKNVNYEQLEAVKAIQFTSEGRIS